jgi:YidC/Oxa1 family membrane protein insertase
MFLQQKLSPPPGDPAQAKVMMMLPIIFTFIFINFPAGLVLYWLTNNVLSIAQQYYITRKTA